MGTFLFDDIVFGPVESRRLGNSLGINLLPTKEKVCNFNCVYCECGLTKFSKSSNFPNAKEIYNKLKEQLEILQSYETLPDSITFAGNGEPTLHPEFDRIIDDTVELRNKYCPNTIISVLTNATAIHRDETRLSLDKIDQNILKLDSARVETIKLVNCPTNEFNLDVFIESAQKFKNKPMVQTLFFRGTYRGVKLDNTRDIELGPWLKAIRTIDPKNVMIYTIARDTAVKNLEKVGEAELRIIGNTVENIGIPVLISG